MDWRCGSSGIEHLICKHKAMSSNPSLTIVIIIIINGKAVWSEVSLIGS
jgi:hypothetical protein